jgi:hypothetical protein
VTKVSNCRSALRPSFLSRSAEATSLSVRVAQAATSESELFLEHGVLGEQILSDPLVVARHPSGDRQQQKLQR